MRLCVNVLGDMLMEAVQVVVIGAGISGITAAILFPAKIPGIDLTIFEKNSDVVSIPFSGPRILLTISQGGTWFENI